MGHSHDLLGRRRHRSISPRWTAKHRRNRWPVWRPLDVAPGPRSIAESGRCSNQARRAVCRCGLACAGCFLRTFFSRPPRLTVARRSVASTSPKKAPHWDGTTRRARSAIGPWGAHGEPYSARASERGGHFLRTRVFWKALAAAPSESGHGWGCNSIGVSDRLTQLVNRSAPPRRIRMGVLIRARDHPRLASSGALENVNIFVVFGFTVLRAPSC